MTTALVPARYYQRISEVLARQGIDIVSVFNEANIDPMLLAVPDGMLEIEQIERIVHALLRQTGRHDLPLDVGRHIQLGSHSIAGYGIMSSPTIDYALRLTSRYFRLIFPPFRVRIRRQKDKFIVLFQPSMPMSHECLEFHIEVVAVAAHFDIQELLGTDLPRYQLLLSITEPRHAARYRELRGAEPRFSALSTPGIRMEFPAEIAGHRPATADPALLGMAEQRCGDLLNDAVAERNVSGWVSMMLRESGDGMPTMDELAHMLNISTRTLDRHLLREGVKFRELSKSERHRKACTLLARPGMSITHIAYELGYSDAANFTRAFRQIAGCSPSIYRDQTGLPNDA